MRNRKMLLLICVFIFTCFSCVQQLIPALEIESCKFEKDEIVFIFSDSVKETSFRNSVSVCEDDSVISGKIIFEENCVKIILENGIQNNKNYRVNVSASLEDIKGRSLAKDYVFEHTTRTENIPPEILKVVPEKCAVQEELREIEIYFSEAIDVKSFYDAFSVTPSFDYICEFNSQKKSVKIIPISPLKQCERYLLNISTELKDENQNPLKNEYSTYFDFFIDYEKPFHEVSIVENDLITKVEPDSIIELNRQKKLLFEWNEKIALDSVNNLVFIEPAIPFEIKPYEQTQKNFIIDFDLTGMWGIDFELKIVKGIKDVAGNATEKDFIYKLNYSDENERPVTFNCGFIKNGSTYKKIKSENQFDSIIFDIQTFPVTSGNNYVQTELFLVFSVSDNSNGIERFSAMENIGLTATNNCCDLMIKQLEILTSDSDLLNELKNENPDLFSFAENQGKFSIVRCLVEIENTEKKGLISLSIKQEISDDLKNTMEKDVICKVNKL